MGCLVETQTFSFSSSSSAALVVSAEGSRPVRTSVTQDLLIRRTFAKYFDDPQGFEVHLASVPAAGPAPGQVEAAHPPAEFPETDVNARLRQHHGRRLLRQQGCHSRSMSPLPLLPLQMATPAPAAAAAGKPPPGPASSLRKQVVLHAKSKSLTEEEEEEPVVPAPIRKRGVALLGGVATRRRNPSGGGVDISRPPDRTTGTHRPRSDDWGRKFTKWV